MLANGLIQLRAWCNEDLSFLASLRNDLSAQGMLLARARGNSLDQVRDWVDKRSRQVDAVFLIISLNNDGRACGFIQATEIDLINSNAALGICLSSEIRGRGIGGLSINLLADYLRDQWRMRKLTVKVRSDNETAIRCYERAGFVRCGLLTEHAFIDARWRDIVLMECFLAAAT
jgi:RimJ/RimL family protein N-acetyltransferase